MGRRSKIPEISEAETLSREQIELRINQLKDYLSIISGGGAARHQAIRSLASWEAVLERRLGVLAPKRPIAVNVKITDALNASR